MLIFIVIESTQSLFSKNIMNKLTSDYLHTMTRNTKGFDKIFEKIKFTKLEKGRCLAEFTVGKEHVNLLGELHGGMSAALVDAISTLVLATSEDEVVFNVTVDTHLMFLKSAKIEDIIEIEAKTIKSGKTLAFVEMFIKNKTTGELLVKGNHTAYLLRHLQNHL